MPRDTSEEDLAREISEDRRLVGLGINPNLDPMEIMLALEQRMRDLKGLEESEAEASRKYREALAASKKGG
ncbi:hypothetical protein [Limnoglobus roseus]|uniref:Uncharacterized protein n=1 Tax=Limnoglobus roseus TaxID=2598579 RepID=A0A5C1A932_9BACT|nr:hypothetical protein [Limnoglobus roseus]QEL14737.1 hypothetical protein PX52LOC_01631 [Limnoglobus roseus]